MRQFDVTELDFDKIKENIKNYFKNKEGGEYSDWDFEGSGLNHLLDILAYNTHYNAVLAHQSVNESFLDSAQIRSNVVSRAKLLGYTPKSIIAPIAEVELSFQSEGNEESYSIDAGKKFTANIDGSVYVFVTTESYTTTQKVYGTGRWLFPKVALTQGEVRKSRYNVDATSDVQSFILVDDTADISTMKVKVYDNQNLNDSNVNIFNKFTTLTDINSETKVYFPFENYEGNHVIEFGNGIIGAKLDSLNVVELEYISTDGESANGANVFKWADEGRAPSSITTLSRASGGAPREGIESIRFNAPKSFITQNRAVTADDYKAILLRDFPSIQSISVWGGQDNDPPQYGKVFISIKESGTEEGTPISDQTREQIKKAVSSEKVIAIIPEIVDPEFTHLYFNIFFKYNPNLTPLTEGQLEDSIRDLIQDYSDEELEKYENVFRHSQLLRSIDNSNVSILNSLVRVFIYKKLKLTSATNVSQTLDFNLQLYSDKPEGESIIGSDPWLSPTGVLLRMGDEKIENEDNKRNIYTYTISGEQEVRVDNSIGSLTINDGKISFTNIPVNAADNNKEIKIFTSPASNDIPAIRNNLLTIDTTLTTIDGEVDTLSTGNIAATYNTFTRD